MMGAVCHITSLILPSITTGLAESMMASCVSGNPLCAEEFVGKKMSEVAKRVTNVTAVADE